MWEAGEEGSRQEASWRSEGGLDDDDGDGLGDDDDNCPELSFYATLLHML